MHNLRCSYTGIIRIVLLLMALFSAVRMPAQRQTSRTPANAPGTSSSAASDERTLEDTRQQLLKLLRMTPTMTSAVAHDPSLLSDQPYVARSNPALAQFLETHPEVTRNPEFYLFANVQGKDRARGLQRAVWPELPSEFGRSAWDALAPFLAIALILGGLFWLVRLLVENFRWNRAFKVQTEMQSRLLDKFATNEELIAYLDTDAGKRILQLPAIPSSIEPGPRPVGMLGRMLTPLQLGAVLISVGIGLQILHHSFPGDPGLMKGLMIFGTLALTLGIGLVVAAGVSWLMASHYGLLPQLAGAQAENGAARSVRGQQ
jgi:hypothetical protein